MNTQYHVITAAHNESLGEMGAQLNTLSLYTVICK